MYVLCSPCILTPALRAAGITRPSDIELFERAIERCRTFGIGMVPLPCPETIYLGSDRQPGTFLERLNTPEFADLLRDLENQVRDIVRQRGPPLCIIGVNSSPTCGVTSTYYGEADGQPAKRQDRGVFLKQFPQIPALDVGVFSQYRVYLAAPLFSEAEREFNAATAKFLREHCYEVYLPQDTGDDRAGRHRSENEEIFQANTRELDRSDIVVACIDGADADSGTSWEMGYAYARGTPVIAYRTDFRRVGAHEHVNLMLEESAKVVTTRDGLLGELGYPVPGDRRKGKTSP
jgi:nucleoside 2-deoxyribosyltransferase/predicted secreted protein